MRGLLKRGFLSKLAPKHRLHITRRGFLSLLAAAAVASTATLVPVESEAARLIVGSRVAGGTDPFPLYTAFDRNTVPPHTASGDWGTQRVIVAPTQPSGMTSASVANMAELESALTAGSRNITLTADINNGEYHYLVDASISNCRINLNGHLLKSVAFGNGFSSTVGERLEIVGPGKCGQISWNGAWSDVIVRDLEAFGPGLQDGVGDVHAFGYSETTQEITRIAFINVYAACGSEFWIGTSRDLYVFNCNITTGLITPRPVNDEAWGFRNAINSKGYTIYVDCIIEGVRFHRIRQHGGSEDMYTFIDRCEFRDAVESRIYERSMHSGIGTLGYHAVWARNITIYATGGSANWVCDYTEPGAPTGYVRYENFTVYSDTFTSQDNFQYSGTVNGAKTGTWSFNVYTTPPAWGSPGDPTTITWDI